jgi:hypothetical protein
LKQDGYDDCITKHGAQLALDATPYQGKGIQVSIRQHTSADVSIREHTSALDATPYEGSGIEGDAVGVAALKLIN